MADFKTLLERAADITKRKIAVVTKDGSMVYPEDPDFSLTYGEAGKKAGKNWKGWNIYRADAYGDGFFVCIGGDRYYESETVALVILLLSSAFDENNTEGMYLRKAVEGKYDASELDKLEENLKPCLPGYLLMVDNLGDSGGEIIEILKNSMNVKRYVVCENRIVAIAAEKNISEACGCFVKNVLEELLIECRAVIGGKAARASELHGLYKNCMDALGLKHVYGLKENVLEYDRMYGYRVAYGLDSTLKKAIKEKVFTAEFSALVDSELGITIEEFFRNNLNLTDTAAKLYIHRNTLLYRLGKIYKCTGFDLRKFEDSWLFRLAWIINKENAIYNG